jgi:hypothetical protein
MHRLVFGRTASFHPWNVRPAVKDLRIDHGDMQDAAGRARGLRQDFRITNVELIGIEGSVLAE